MFSRGGGWVGRIEVFVKIQKKKNGGGGRGGDRVGVGLGVVRVDVIEELKFLGKFTKKKSGVGGGREGRGSGGGGWVGGGSGWM